MKVTTETVMRQVFAATPAQLEAVNAVFTGKAKPVVDPLLSPAEAGRRIGCTRENVWRLMKRGHLRSVITPAGMRKVPESAVEEYRGGTEQTARVLAARFPAEALP